MREPIADLRNATSRDAATIEELLAVHASPHRGAEDLTSLVGGSDGQWLVAEVGGVIVGAARVCLDRIPRPAVLAVVVRREARGLGIGASLLDDARRIARESGHTNIDALALPGDRETKNLYERAGLTARMIVASGDA